MLYSISFHIKYNPPVLFNDDDDAAPAADDCLECHDDDGDGDDDDCLDCQNCKSPTLTTHWLLRSH